MKTMCATKRCEACFFYGRRTGTCDYIFWIDERRPCPAGKACTVRLTGKEWEEQVRKPTWDVEEGYRMYLEGKKDAEIADAFRISAGAVASIRKKRWENAPHGKVTGGKEDADGLPKRAAAGKKGGKVRAGAMSKAAAAAICPGSADETGAPPVADALKNPPVNPTGCQPPLDKGACKKADPLPAENETPEEARQVTDLQKKMVDEVEPGTRNENTPLMVEHTEGADRTDVDPVSWQLCKIRAALDGVYSEGVARALRKRNYDIAFGLVYDRRAIEEMLEKLEDAQTGQAVPVAALKEGNGSVQ